MAKSNSCILIPVIETLTRIDPAEILSEKRVQSGAYGCPHVVDLREMLPGRQTCLEAVGPESTRQRLDDELSEQPELVVRRVHET